MGVSPISAKIAHNLRTMVNVMTGIFAIDTGDTAGLTFANTSSMSHGSTGLTFDIRTMVDMVTNSSAIRADPLVLRRMSGMKSDRHNEWV